MLRVLCGFVFAGEDGFSTEQREVAERLSTHRWERYLRLRPEFR